MSFLSDLDAYELERTNKFNRSGKRQYFFSIFGIPLRDGAIAYNEKITAYNQMKTALNGQPVKFTDKDFAAFNDGDLRKVIMKNFHSWPRGFGQQFNAYKERAADLERRLYQNKRDNLFVFAALGKF